VLVTATVTTFEFVLTSLFFWLRELPQVLPVGNFRSY